jgi:phosphoribosyl-AMP cyclohydrolase
VLAGFSFLGRLFWGEEEGEAMEIDFGKMDGLVPAVVQESTTGEVLMVGFMNGEALAETMRSGDVTFYSRSRRKLWKKGETSGHVLRLVELLVDCDADTVLARVEMRGPGACHEGFRSCFFRRMGADGGLTTTGARAFDPAAVYGGEAR